MIKSLFAKSAGFDAPIVIEDCECIPVLEYARSLVGEVRRREDVVGSPVGKGIARRHLYAIRGTVPKRAPPGRRIIVRSSPPARGGASNAYTACSASAPQYFSRRYTSR